LISWNRLLLLLKIYAYSKILWPLEGLLTHGAPELSLALMIMVYVAFKSTRICRFLVTDGTTMLGSGWLVHGAHVLLEAGHVT